MWCPPHPPGPRPLTDSSPPPFLFFLWPPSLVPGKQDNRDQEGVRGLLGGEWLRQRRDFLPEGPSIEPWGGGGGGKGGGRGPEPERDLVDPQPFHVSISSHLFPYQAVSLFLFPPNEPAVPRLQVTVRSLGVGTLSATPADPWHQARSLGVRRAQQSLPPAAPPGRALLHPVSPQSTRLGPPQPAKGGPSSTGPAPWPHLRAPQPRSPAARAAAAKGAAFPSPQPSSRPEPPPAPQPLPPPAWPPGPQLSCFLSRTMSWTPK